MLLIGFLNRYADRHRLIPTGGVRYPNSRFERKMIPSCTGWIPKPSATGVNIGTRMMMAENTSMNEPLTSSRQLSSSRNAYLEWMCVRTHSIRSEEYTSELQSPCN